MTNSVALPVIEYRAITECGRILSWSATSPESAMYEIKRDKLLSVVEIMPFKLWEALQEDGFKQLELNSEIEGANTAA
jgi:hypothetical protein